jgi:hypothetical protein
MKRLFAIRDSRGQLVRNEEKQPMYFADKQAARAYRSKLTQATDMYYVTYGIDHKLYKGQ